MGFGARKFEGKKISIQLAQVGVSLWIVACSIGSIYARPEPERRDGGNRHCLVTELEQPRASLLASLIIDLGRMFR
jgi:hypothetical protein